MKFSLFVGVRLTEPLVMSLELHADGSISFSSADRDKFAIYMLSIMW